MLEDRCASISGVNSLRDLGELEGITKQDEVAGGGSNGQRVRERYLAGLVDEEVVERLVHVLLCEQPGGAGDELHFFGRREVSRVTRTLNELAFESRLLV